MTSFWSVKVTPMFFSIAYAAAEAEDVAGPLASNLVPMVLICVVFYFLIIRPHQVKAKKHKQMLDALQAGDKVVTAGGLVGVVCSVTGGSEEISVEVAKNVKVSIIKSAVTDVIVDKSQSPVKV